MFGHKCLKMTLTARILVFCTVLWLPSIAKGANILVLHPIYSGSHDLVLRTIGDALIERGHNVTQIRFPQRNSRKSTHSDLNTRVNVITLPIIDEENTCSRYINEDGEFDIHSLGSVIWNKLDAPFKLPTDVYCSTHIHCKMILRDKRLYRALQASKFDIAIVDMIANECGLALARALGLPVVTFWGFGYQGGEVMYTSTWNPASIVPAFMTGMDRNMNFMQRSVNLLFYLTHAVLEFWQASISDIYIKESYPELGSSARLIHGIDLSLVNINFFVDYPRLTAPNTKYVGPMHLKEAGPLPPQFQNFVDGSEHGVILFSLGFTGFLPHDIPRETMDGFLHAFSRIKQRVIMKFDPSVLSFIPKNVMVVDWFPQIDLLGHNNTLVFISHCGMNGVSEAIYHRVPILGMPIFADQADNAAKLKDRGIGLTLDRHNIQPDDVIYKINQLIENPKYKTQVDRFADIWRDHRFTPIEEATYWIELLHKYGNLDHLRINDGDLNLAQYLCLDVLVFWTCVSLLSTYLLLVFARRLWNKNVTVLQIDPDVVNNNNKKNK